MSAAPMWYCLRAASKPQTRMLHLVCECVLWSAVSCAFACSDSEGGSPRPTPSLADGEQRLADGGDPASPPASPSRAAAQKDEWPLLAAGAHSDAVMGSKAIVGSRIFDSGPPLQELKLMAAHVFCLFCNCAGGAWLFIMLITEGLS